MVLFDVRTFGADRAERNRWRISPRGRGRGCAWYDNLPTFHGSGTVAAYPADGTGSASQHTLDSDVPALMIYGLRSRRCSIAYLPFSQRLNAPDCKTVVWRAHC